jgi:two-component system phosphate regulon response regulator PhoB
MVSARSCCALVLRGCNETVTYRQYYAPPELKRKNRSVATILIVEDEADIQELIAYNLEKAGYEAVRAGDAEQALDIVRAALPHLVIIDWMLPGMSGIELAKSLRANKRTAGIPLIMVTARGAEQDKLAGLEIGADDYMTKPFSPRELNARVKAVLRRRAPQVTDDSVEVAGLKLDPASHRITANGGTLDLGPTEFRLLHFFMTHPERVYSRAQLLDSVWGDHVFVEERTVDVHIRRLRKALEATGHDRLVQTVRSAGYRFSPA